MSSDSRILALGLGVVLCVLGAGNALFDMSATAEGPWRMIGLSGIFGTGLVGLWLLRSPAAALGCFLAAVVVGVILLFFRVDTFVFRSLFWTLGYGIGIWLAGWAILRFVLPRIEPANARAALMLAAVMMVGHLAIGFAMFQPADAFFSLQAAPVHSTQATLSEAARNPNVGQTRIDGVLVQGVIAGQPGGLARMHYRCGLGRQGTGVRILNRTQFTSPPRFGFVTADGAEIETTGLRSVAGAIGWPDLPDQIGCGLVPGDPVVIWATPLNAGDGRVYLTDTRLMAHGDAEAFRIGVAQRAEFGARQFGGLAFLVMITGLYPMILCLWTWRRLRRQRG